MLWAPQFLQGGIDDEKHQTEAMLLACGDMLSACVAALLQYVSARRCGSR